MKNRIIYLIFALPAILSACERDIAGFDADKAYLYFEMPRVRDYVGRETDERIDSISYSFALEDYTVMTAYVAVPICIIGTAVDYDRNYEIEIVADKTTATDADWDKSSIATSVIEKGKLYDTLYVKVNRTDELLTKWKNIGLRIIPNDNFQLGYSNLTEMKVSFSDILPEPDWWYLWRYYFGEYHREIFIKWQEIYYLGADPNVNKYGSGPGQGELLYWDNMPYPVEGWFPSTFMFLRILKQYFIDNEVYPNGDKSQPRILLP